MKFINIRELSTGTSLIKKRGSTENTKDTEKNTLLPSVFFRAFRGQEKRNLRVIEMGKMATRSVPISLHRNIERNDVLGRVDI